MRSSSKDITFEDLTKYFHLPINQVAKELGICATILKKICRKNGIPRWPHRKIKSLDKRLALLEDNLKKEEANTELEAELALLRHKKNDIMKNPALLVKNPGANVYALKPSTPLAKKSNHNHSSSLSKVSEPFAACRQQTSFRTNTFPLQNITPAMVSPIPITVGQHPSAFYIPSLSMDQQSHSRIMQVPDSSNFLDFVVRANTNPLPPPVAHRHSSLESIFSSPISSPSRELSSPSFLPPVSQISQNASKSNELPPFKILYDIVEGERARLTKDPAGPTDRKSVV